jgi:hypothetical protein
MPCLWEIVKINGKWEWILFLWLVRHSKTKVFHCCLPHWNVLSSGVVRPNTCVLISETCVWVLMYKLVSMHYTVYPYLFPAKCLFIFVLQSVNTHVPLIQKYCIGLCLWIVLPAHSSWLGHNLGAFNRQSQSSSTTIWAQIYILAK